MQSLALVHLIYHNNMHWACSHSITHFLIVFDTCVVKACVVKALVNACIVTATLVSDHVKDLLYALNLTLLSC